VTTSRPEGVAGFYANENFPLPVVEELRRLGHQVLTSHEAGNSGRAVSDEDVLAYARAQQRAVLTLNRKHVIRLHREHPDQAGIVVCTYDPDFTGQAQRIYSAVLSEGDLRARLIRVNRPNPPP
jgi:hypothetical protein